MKFSALHRPGAIVTIAAVWLLSRSPFAPNARSEEAQNT